MRTWLVAVVLAGCASSSSVECAFGLTCPEGTQCDEMHTGCATQEQFDVCAGKGLDPTNRESCTAEGIVDGVCDLGVCLGANCGDGVRTPAEICDGAEINSEDSCADFAYYGGSLTCTATCTLELSTCSGTCGDGEVNGPELCDGSLPSATCIDQGFGAGFLECSETCGPESDDCIPFGWRAIDFPHDIAVVHGTSPTNIWIAGKAGMVQRFDGTTWSAIDIDACTNSDLFELFVLSETDAIVADPGGVIRISATGCAYDLVAPNIDALWAASPTDIYAGSLDGLWHYTGGTTWQSVDAQPSRVIWGRSATDIYRADSTLPEDVLHFDGQSWTDANVPTLGTVNAIWGNAQEVFVSGICNGDDACVVRHDGNGWDNWLANRAGYTATSEAWNGAGDSSQTFVVAFDYTNGPVGTVLASDGMMSNPGWANLDAPFFGLEATPFWTGRTLYLAARESNRLFVFDGTAHLGTLPPPSGIANMAVARADDAVVAAGGQAWGWNGAAWSFETNSVVDVTLAVSSGTVLVVGSGGVRERTSAGVYSTVKAVAGGRVVGQSFNDFFVLATQTSIVHHNGTNTASPMAQPIRDLVSVTPSFAIAVGDNGFIAHWNGSSWTTQTLTPPVTYPIFQVTARSATDAHAMTNHSLLRWDGVSWTPMPLPTTDLLYDVNGGAGDLFLATRSGLFHHDGMRWSPVDTGDLSPVQRIASRGTSTFWVEPATVDQLVRIRPW